MKINKFKNENGSVTLFVLISLLFFLAVGVSVFVTTMNSSTNQKKELKKIQSQYNNAGDLNVVYEKQREKLNK